MIDGLNNFLETITYLIVIAETVIKVGRWLKRKKQKAPKNRQQRKNKR